MSDLILIGKGWTNIKTTAGFWKVSKSGLNIAGANPGEITGRKFKAEEKQQLISDYKKYREYLQEALDEVVEAESIILNAPTYVKGEKGLAYDKFYYPAND